MTHQPSRSVAPFLDRLLASGRVVFSGQEAEKALDLGRGAFLDAAEKLQRRGQLVRPRQDFYVVVPPQYRNLGSPPPSWFIDDLMRRESHPYYVGLLKAAELHGAAHHAAMEFQVVTDKRMPMISVGRSRIAFYYRKDMTAVLPGIEDRKTEAGTMKISCPELTLLDLVRYPQASGGLDNVLTIIDAFGSPNAEKLKLLAGAFERSVLQRAGYLLDRAGLGIAADRLDEMLRSGVAPPWIELDPSLASAKDFAPSIMKRDERWHLKVRRIPEREE